MYVLAILITIWHIALIYWGSMFMMGKINDIKKAKKLHFTYWKKLVLNKVHKVYVKWKILEVKDKIQPELTKFGQDYVKKLLHKM